MGDLVYLAHHGVKGQKHGERKYQNKDGSLTPLGRIHYGVGAAKEAVRKKVAPTNAELNVQIRKQKSKNLNKEKKRQLKLLKKGIDVDAQSKLDRGNSKGPHKKFSEMSDKEIDERIGRLKKEATLAELEATKNLTPGKKMIYDVLKESGKRAASKVLEEAFTKAGKEFLGLTEDKKEEPKSAKQLVEELKAQEELDNWYKKHGSGSSSNSSSSGSSSSNVKSGVRDAAKKAGSTVGKVAKKVGKAAAYSAKKSATDAKNVVGAYVSEKQKKKSKSKVKSSSPSNSTALAIRR